MEAAAESRLLRWLRGLPAPVRAAFWACFGAGFGAHLYAFTNIIPNSDGISRVYDAQQMTVSGRWFLHYASMWNGYLQAPAVIGFFSLLFLALAAALTVSLLKLRTPLSGALAGALMAVFPSMAYTCLYLFTASAYCFGILLAVLSVWLLRRLPRWGILPAALLLACAVGTYQAYLAVAASLVLLCVVLRGLEQGSGCKALLGDALRSLLYLVLGLALYYGILRIFLAVKDLELLNYKGISSLGSGLGPLELLKQIGAAYLGFFRYFFVPGSFASYTTPLSALLHGVLALAGLWALLRLLGRGGWGRRPLALACLLVLCLLLPLAMNLTVLMGEPMPIMRYALVFAYLPVLWLTERALRRERPASGEAAGKGTERPGPAGPARVAALLAALGLCLVSFYVDNVVYTGAAQAHRATQSFATRLVERVESAPGYEAGMEVLIVGGFPSKQYHSELEVYELTEDYSAPSGTVIPLNKHVYYYLNDWLNVPWPEPEEKTLIALSDSEAFRAMPLYPSDGSVAVVDGKVVVKLASRYTPKKDYEIAYENRR